MKPGPAVARADLTVRPMALTADPVAAVNDLMAPAAHQTVLTVDLVVAASAPAAPAISLRHRIVLAISMLPRPLLAGRPNGKRRLSR